jgi:hypothetical protein
LLNQTIDPDTYIRGISDEAERRRIKGRAKEEKEAAFNANGNSSGHGRRGNKRSTTVECFNCHKKGHIKAECWAKGGGKEGQGPRGKGKGRAVANKAADDDDGVWYAHADSSEADSELDDWKEVVETNLAGYVEPWFEYAQEGGKERLEGLSGTYLHDEIAQPYAERAMLQWQQNPSQTLSTTPARIQARCIRSKPCLTQSGQTTISPRC